MKSTLTLLIGSLLLLSCTSKVQIKSYNFYHWKSKAVWDDAKSQVLKKTKASKIYMRYFDINIKRGTYKACYPTYVIREIDPAFKNFDIIPVVFIRNIALKDTENSVEELANNIKSLVNQIHQKHFGGNPTAIQIDCDWNNSTELAFFSLLTQLKKDFSVETTLRLHQIKYPEKTGVPPVDRATLMLYNMGQLKDFTQNSLIDKTIVDQYISRFTKYEKPISLGLPLFDQTVIQSPTGKIKLLNGAYQSDFAKDPAFKQISPLVYEIQKDSLIHGFYVTKGCQFKTEKTTKKEVLESLDIIRKSNLSIEEVVFYHLDSHTDKNEIITAVMQSK